MPSRLFIDWNERSMEGTAQDAGAYIRDDIKSIAKQGVCKETQWPYVIIEYAAKPSKSCFQHAKKYTAISCFRLNNATLDELKSCLAAGVPSVFGFAVYPSSLATPLAASCRCPARNARSGATPCPPSDTTTIPSPDISHLTGASGRRISESCFARTTLQRFEERPDADRV
jgi:C1A family cysteine protease